MGSYQLVVAVRQRATDIQGAILASQSSWGQAAPLLAESTRKLMDRLRKIPLSRRWYARRACERTITLYQQWGKPDEVAERKVKLADIDAQIERLRNAALADSGPAESVEGVGSDVPKKVK